MSRGYSLLEVLVAFTVMAIICGAAIPLAHNGADRARAAAAASYLAGRMAMARFEAVRRSAHVAIRFVEDAEGCWLQTFVDGNGNGVLSADVASGLDRAIALAERLDHHFPGVRFGIQPGVTGLDPGQPFNAGDPIQIGSSSFLSFNPVGSSTSGTLFIHGQRRSQYAVRLLGATGRTRIFTFNFEEGTWQAR